MYCEPVALLNATLGPVPGMNVPLCATNETATPKTDTPTTGKSKTVDANETVAVPKLTPRFGSDTPMLVVVIHHQ